ncbi:MAG: RNA methyltransferase [Bacteroidales bacterium]|nr:RNA methyltransferase [Bacteroidales bacterium]
MTSADIKYVRSLREKKFRDEYGLFTVEGEKMVKEAVDSSFDVVDIYRKEDIGEDAMARISSFSTPSPVLAVVRQKHWEKPSLDSGLFLALDSVRDPGNMGTIIRLADWFGIEAVFASEDSVELYNPKVIQSTMGAIFRKKVIFCSIPDLCDEFRGLGREVYGTFLDGENIYTRHLDKEGLVIMGNESNGISDEVRARVSGKLLIPSFAKGPTAESLNVAVATAITLSEFRR